MTTFPVTMTRALTPARVLSEGKAQANHDKNLLAILDAATTPEPLRPALTRPIVDAWSMTSLKEHTGRPEIEVPGFVAGSKTTLPKQRSSGGRTCQLEVKTGRPKRRSRRSRRFLKPHRHTPANRWRRKRFR